MIKGGVDPGPERVKAARPSIESICDGPHFGPLKGKGDAAPSEGDTQYLCCNSKCNDIWGSKGFS